MFEKDMKYIYWSFVHLFQADSFKMAQEFVKNSPGGVGSLEQLLGLSGDDRASVGHYSKAGREADTGPGLLIGGGPGVGGAGDGVDQLLSSVNSLGTRARYSKCSYCKSIFL